MKYPVACDLSGSKFINSNFVGPNLIGMNLEGMGQLVQAMGEAPFRARQLYRWIYARGIHDFSQMTDMSKDLRARFANHCHIALPAITSHQKSDDGTEKWLLRYADGNEVECVYIPEDERGTLCISSQVGCALTCTFCHTGTQRLVRNLSAGDIVAQVMIARNCLKDWPFLCEKLPCEKRRITNIVFMGMGEPLYNTRQVIQAVELINDGDGIAIGRRKVTLSTSGVVPEMKKAGDAGMALAVSLHAVRDDLRNILVPINRKYPIGELIQAVRSYPGLSNTRRVTWEYVMLKGINDNEADARALLKLIKGIPSKINLIPFNPWPGSDYKCSSMKQIQKFAQIIWDAGYSAPIRRTRGQDILAACGQLKSASQRLSKKERLQFEKIRAEKEKAVGLI